MGDECLYLPTWMVTGTTVVVVCYRSYWFGTGTSDVRYRNIALESGMLPELRRDFTRCCFTSNATDNSTNLGLKQDMPGLLVHQISQRCYFWCGRDRRLKFFVFIRDPARVSVTMRLLEPWLTSDCIINIHRGEAGQLAVARIGSAHVAMLLLPDFTGAAAGKHVQVVGLPGTPRRSVPIER